ncbi:unnamed protein product [Cuscuta epithymum]|uniref:RRM domain-containing protein n=1 Tax=Cuscuta epithymum TaxID=186058 RepID=A0AAV0F9B5_9ASTE|nr:unnamed protein product [Cuscuta epithymum]
MDDPGIVRFPGTLDPCAQEFFPTNNPFSSLFPPPCFPHFPFHRPPPPHYDGAGCSVLAPPPLQSPDLPLPAPSPTRAVLVSMVSPDVSESMVRREMETFGDVRAVQMERVRQGIVTVHFYDLRHAVAAVAEIQEQHMQQQYRLRLHYESVMAAAHHFPPPPPPARGLIAGRAVWAQFVAPDLYAAADGGNQGTLIIFNLDTHISNSQIRDIFESFGAVKELRESPVKRNQRFVEFYDVRDAARALSEMNQKEINSRKILIQYSRPGGSAVSTPRFLPPPPAAASFPPHRAAAMPHPRCYGGEKLKRNSKGNEGSSVRESMASLCLTSGNSNWDGSSSSSTSSKQNRRGNNRRSWKGGSNNKNNKDREDPRFLINEDAIEADSGDLRTTVMIKNIPNKYSQKLLLNMLDNHCIHCNDQIAGTDGGDLPKSSYDFVYLPIDFINKCNVGYGFVNMTSPQATWRLYKAFHQQSWEVFNSRKVCQVSYARLQGLEALKEHFKNSKFPRDAEEYMPVVFSPPRDGKTLTDPVPIVDCPVLTSPQNPSGSMDDNDCSSGDLGDDS